MSFSEINGLLDDELAKANSKDYRALIGEIRRTKIPS